MHFFEKYVKIKIEDHKIIILMREVHGYIVGRVNGKNHLSPQKPKFGRNEISFLPPIINPSLHLRILM